MPAFSDKEHNYSDLLPNSKLSVSRPHLIEFFETMFERQEIWYKRFVEKKDRPWTKDKFFANHKFTNVYRELDRSSQWLINNVILKAKDERNLIFQILLYRI